MKAFTLSLATLACLVARAYGQEFTFSQAGQVRQALNPARVADMPEDARGTAAYRNQWYAANQPYAVLFAGAELSYRFKKADALRRIGAQVSFADDNLARGTLRTQWVQLAGSYTQSLDVARRHQLSAGLGLAAQMRRLGADGLTFGNQFDAEALGYNPALPSGEGNLARQQTFAQVSLGLAYRFYQTERLSWRADVAYLGINKLQESFSTEARYAGFSQKRRLSFLLSAQYQTKGRLVLEPMLFYNRQGPAYELLAGSWVLLSQSRYARKQMQWGAGLFVRPGDAVIPGVRLEYDRWAGALTYDATYSSARQAANRNSLIGLGGMGSLEATLTYRLWYTKPTDGPSSVPCRAF